MKRKEIFHENLENLDIFSERCLYNEEITPVCRTKPISENIDSGQSLIREQCYEQTQLSLRCLSQKEDFFVRISEREPALSAH